MNNLTKLNPVGENRRDLLIELVKTNFKLRYNNSVLGFIWVLLKPLLMFSVLYIVFSNFRAGWVENYQIYLLTGVILFTYFNEGIVFGMNSLMGIAHIILKVNFPRVIALQSGVIMSVINMLANLVILTIFALFNPIAPTFLSVVYLVYLLFLLSLIIYAVSMFTSIWIVKLRDLEHITVAFMQLFFYSIPIIYPITILPASLQKIVMLNPIAVIIIAAREALIDGRIAYVNSVMVITLITLVLLLLGNMYFRKSVKCIAELF